MFFYIWNVADIVCYIRFFSIRKSLGVFLHASPVQINGYIYYCMILRIYINVWFDTNTYQIFFNDICKKMFFLTAKHAIDFHENTQ